MAAADAGRTAGKGGALAVTAGHCSRATASAHHDTMMMRRRDQAMTEAVTEQRRREDAAPRLRDVIQELQSLRFHLEDVRDEGRMKATPYVRPIVVATAPAHFEIRCMEPRCDGRHDITHWVMHALRHLEVSFTGQSDCGGMVGDVPCDRTLGYAGEATYRA